MAALARATTRIRAATVRERWPKPSRIAVLAFVFLLLYSNTARAQEKSEYDVKAAFLMNFTKFVEWPASAFRDEASPLTICVLGDDPFGAALDRAVTGETAGGRRLAVLRIRRSPAPQTCQVLFVSSSEKNPAEVLEGLEPGVLTVGDHEGFLKQGGIIAFVLQARHVRFDINRQAAARAALNISSRLLSVARKVQP